MAENSRITCQGCGEVFTEFLQDMADHNEKVVCPSCGHVHDHKIPEKIDIQERHAESNRNGSSS
jgi:uncharacterized Zn finger protein